MCTSDELGRKSRCTYACLQ